MSVQFCSGKIAAGDGNAGAAPMSSLIESGEGTIGTDNAKGAATGDGLPLIVARLCGDLLIKEKREKN